MSEVIPFRPARAVAHPDCGTHSAEERVLGVAAELRAVVRSMSPTDAVSALAVALSETIAESWAPDGISEALRIVNRYVERNAGLDIAAIPSFLVSGDNDHA